MDSLLILVPAALFLAGLWLRGLDDPSESLRPFWTLGEGLQVGPLGIALEYVGDLVTGPFSERAKHRARITSCAEPPKRTDPPFGAFALCHDWGVTP